MSKKTRNFILLLIVSLAFLITSCRPEVEEFTVPPELPEDTESLVMLAKFDLSIRTGAEFEDISTKSVEETLFNDSSLGVPQPGAVYDPVTTPGYIIMLEFDGENYEYHASGEKVVLVPKAE